MLVPSLTQDSGAVLIGRNEGFAETELGLATSDKKSSPWRDGGAEGVVFQTILYSRETGGEGSRQATEKKEKKTSRKACTPGAGSSPAHGGAQPQPAVSTQNSEKRRKEPTEGGRCGESNRRDRRKRKHHTVVSSSRDTAGRALPPTGATSKFRENDEGRPYVETLV